MTNCAKVLRMFAGNARPQRVAGETYEKLERGARVEIESRTIDKHVYACPW
jgi:hypothetical protein